MKFKALFLALALLVPFASAFPLEARSANVGLQATKALVAMNETIEYFEENGLDAGELISLRDSFQAKLGELDGAAAQGDESAFNQTLQEMHSIAREFKLAVGESDADGQELRERLRERLGNSSEVEKANQTAWQASKQAALHVFDVHLASAQGFVNRTQARFQARNMTANMSGMQDELNDIEAMRGELEAAFDSGDKAQVKQVETEIKSMYRELKKNAARKAVQFAAQVLGKADKLSERLQARGVNSSGLNDDVEALGAALENAENACQTSKEACIDALKDAKQAFKNVRKSAANAVSTGKQNMTRNASAEDEDENETEEDEPFEHGNKTKGKPGAGEDE